MFVGQITKQWNEDQLIDFFKEYGDILEAQIIRNHKTQESKGCAFIKFASMTKGEETIRLLKNHNAPDVFRFIKLLY